jgi:undecaprenyl diphosphate synthase
VGQVPRHVAIIMDGNGRWAQQRGLPRVAGHARGVEAVRTVVEGCARRGVEYLTLFAFSSENWRRPAEEVSVLMQLFIKALQNEVHKLHRHQIRLRVVGDLSAFPTRIRELVSDAEVLTKDNNGLVLTICANYGGRWDLIQAMQALLADEQLHREPALLDESRIEQHLALAYAPEPDLFIRTGGEQRLSNFMIWQLAYTELYFTTDYWPDFDEMALERAFESYRQRERRFGRTSAQLTVSAGG